MRTRALSILFIAAAGCHAAESGDPSAYERDILPLLKEYCITCHSAAKQKGDLDLERFTSMELARRDATVWEHALEQFAEREMPPKDKPQPSREQMQRLTTWMHETLADVARETAGDPGPVVLRRLSNMEYTYTLRDLTGVESLDPAKEFPADGAAGEGFTNAGAALVISPALVSKYLDAAKDVASHAVLLPKGIRFSAGSSPRDWTDELLAEIREFYGRFAIDGDATAVNLQGIKLETNAGGRTPVARYITALLRERDTLRAGKKTIDAVAQEYGLNGRYVAMLWTALTESEKSEVLDQVRSRFNTAAPDEAAQVIGMVSDWQQSLWRFASVGHIGKKNGPKSWQEAANPMGLQHLIRVKLEAPKEAGDLTVYLVTRNIEGEGRDLVTWEDARVVNKELKEVMLRDIPGALPRALTAPTPAVLKIHIPRGMITPEMEFAVTCKLVPHSREEACVQVHVLATPPEHLDLTGLMPSKATLALARGLWTDNNLRSSHNAPLLVNPASATGKRLEAAFEEFRQVFPAALCYTKIVPVDEVVTLTLFYREDDQLKRLMLDETQCAEIDRLWEELRFVSEAPLKQVDVFDQLWQYATQDAKPDAFEPMREPILRGAEKFREDQAMARPRQVLAVLDFAARAWRRPLNSVEEAELRELYEKLRKQELPHDAAIRMLLARVLVAPVFLYRGETAAPGPTSAPVNDWELATRLSYFLWSSAPDDELRSLAASRQLHEPAVLSAQARRMMKDARVRRLATEFGCQWLQVRDLETLDEKSERHFPTFTALRGAMQEEVVRFFTDVFQEDRSALSLLDADYTFVNGPLAEHYSFDVARHSDVESGAGRLDIGMSSHDWKRVDGVHAKGRGGILGFAATLAKQSGASRTSPILRGNWLSEVVLGEKLPRPPKGVPILPDEAPAGLTERQLIERHSGDAACARCHQRIDPFGFALEGFDAIGHARAADTRATLPDGTMVEGVEGLRSYLLKTRRDDFLKQFCRKLLGYALGRSVQLSDQPLLEAMLIQLNTHDCRVSSAVELIVCSEQFKKVRGRNPAPQ